MNTMQFKSFFFPHNPSVTQITRAGRHAALFCPGYGEVVQGLGEGAREIRCSGSFVCPSPEAAAALLEEFEDKTAGSAPGVLALPGLSPLYAVLAEHRFERSGDGRVVPYTMRFLEADPALKGEA